MTKVICFSRENEISWKISTWGMSLRNVFRLTFFPVFSKFQGETKASQKALRLYNSYNHCPCPRPADVGESCPLPQLQVLQSSENLIFMLIATDHHCKKFNFLTASFLCFSILVKALQC